MKLRNFLILIFVLVVLIPSLLFWAWPFSKALDSEINEVKERHLVIAKNLAMALERYHQDVTSAFTLLSSQLGQIDKNPEIIKLLDSYDLQLVMLVSKQTGQISDCIKINNKPCPKVIDKDMLNFAKKFLTTTTPQFSTVIENKELENNAMLMVVMPVEDDNFALGYLSTRYIVKLGKRVAFGKKGHAAILDQAGRVIAHPLQEWIETQKSMVTTSAVQKMMAGKTGVEVFISPAFHNEMIAGYTAVPNAGWGVMVPQPSVELHKKAQTIDRAALLVMLLGLGMALLVAVPVSFMITQPLEKLAKATRVIGRKNKLEENLDISNSPLLPLEVRKLNESFVEMTKLLRENRKSMTRLAYIDMNTKLPNRNSFQHYARQALEEMINSKTKGAMLFIDFDGFKKINDTYGHRAGDELLAQFAKKLLLHFSLWDTKKNHELWLQKNTLPDVIPARLGGDEFVVLFKKILNISDVKQKAESLRSAVFGEYILYGNTHISLSGSIGIALFPEHGSTYEEIIKAADIAMYEAKSLGKGTLSFFKP